MDKIKNRQVTDIRALQLRHQQSRFLKGNNSGSFSKILEEKARVAEEGLKFSKHARERIEKREIGMDEKLISDLGDAVEKARAKGSKEIVVIGDRGAFIVDVKKGTIITGMSKEEMKNNIFTNIDGAVLI